MMHNSKSLLKDALLILLLLAGGTLATTTQRDSTEVNSPTKDLTQDIGAFPSDEHPHVNQMMDQILGRRFMQENETCVIGGYFVWLKGLFAAVGIETLSMLLPYRVFDLSRLHAYYRPRDPNEYFFHDGRLTSKFNAAHQKVQSFWDVPKEVTVLGYHGRALDDIDTLAEIYSYHKAYSNYTKDELTELATTVHALIDSTIGFDHPLLTYGANIISAEYLPPGDPRKNIENRIGVGDGALEYFDSIGLSKTSPEIIYAHEFAHHIQLERGILGENGTLETKLTSDARTRELMADAFAAYYLVHPNGGNFNRDMTEDIYTFALVGGDCDSNYDPITFPGYAVASADERRSAVDYGISLVEKKGKMAKKKGKKSKGVKGKQKANILTSTEFIDLFYDALPTIINPPTIIKPPSKKMKGAKQHDEVNSGY